MRVLLILWTLIAAPAWAQLDMACYERCTNRPDYCQEVCTRQQPSMPTYIPDSTDYSKPFGFQAGAEAGRRRVDEEIRRQQEIRNMQLQNQLLEQRLRQENQSQRQPVARQAESQSERRYDNPRSGRQCESARDCAPDQNCRSIPNSGGGTVCR